MQVSDTVGAKDGNNVAGPMGLMVGRERDSLAGRETPKIEGGKAMSKRSTYESLKSRQKAPLSSVSARRLEGTPGLW